MNWMMGTYLSGKSIQFDGKNPWVSGEDFPNKTNPVTLTLQGGPRVIRDVFTLVPNKKQELGGSPCGCCSYCMFPFKNWRFNMV